MLDIGDMLQRWSNGEPCACPAGTLIWSPVLTSFLKMNMSILCIHYAPYLSTVLESGSCPPRDHHPD